MTFEYNDVYSQDRLNDEPRKTMNVGTESVVSSVGTPPLKRKMPQKLRDFFEMTTRQSNSTLRNQRHQETESTPSAARIAPMSVNTGVGPGGSDL